MKSRNKIFKKNYIFNNKCLFCVRKKKKAIYKEQAKIYLEWKGY